MRPVHHSVRLPVALDKALRALAGRQGISVYAMLQRSVEAGIATLTTPSAPDTSNRELIAELASVSTRMVDVERMLDRALFTACAAYCYARSAALGTRTSDETVRQWGAGKVQTFTPQSMNLKTGDSIRFTRNDREAGRINGARGEVVAVDEQARTATIQTPDGRTEALNLDSARDRHVAHAYVDTAFAAQGRTADHVMIHADSKATNLIDQKSFYVGISRAKESATIFTNDRGKLVAAINERAGQVQTAIAQAAMPTPAAAKASGAGLE